MILNIIPYFLNCITNWKVVTSKCVPSHVVHPRFALSRNRSSLDHYIHVEKEAFMCFLLMLRNLCVHFIEMRLNDLDHSRIAFEFFVVDERSFGHSVVFIPM